MPLTAKSLPPAQRLFEVYGGLGRGFEPKTADSDWFKSIWSQRAYVAIGRNR